MSVKKKIIILVSICLLILVSAIIADRILSKNYYNEISYSNLMKKLDEKGDIIILISQTTCGHCMTYKPKLEDISNTYKVPVYYIDVDTLNENEYKSLNSRLNFSNSGTPLTIFLKNGEETTAANRISGDASREKIINKFKNNGFIEE